MNGEVNCQNSPASTREGDSDERKLVDHYVRSLPDKVHALRDALKEQDWTAVCTCAHQLIGAELFGFESIARLARLMEEQGRKQHPERCGEMLDELVSEVAKVKPTDQGASANKSSLARDSAVRLN